MFDRRAANFLTFYNTCCGYTSTRVIPDSFLGPIGFLGTTHVQGLNYCTGQWEDLTFSSTLSSNPTSIITVSQSTAEVDGLSPGTGSVDAVLYFMQQKTVDTCRSSSFFPQQPATVTPSVTITGGASYVPLRAGTSTGPNSSTLTASGSPAGGSYTWSTSSNKVSLSSTTSATVTVTAASASTSIGDVPISITYTVNGQSATASVNITVEQPTSLQLITNGDTTNPTGHACDATATSNNCQTSRFTGSGTYSSQVRSRTYHVMDQFNPPRWIAGYALDLQESYTVPTGQCAGDSVATGLPGQTGDTVVDCFYFCSATCKSGGSCSVSATQTISANGFTVGTFSVTWTCSGVTIQP